MPDIAKKTLAMLLRRAGLPATKKRIDELIGPARFIEAAGRRLARAEAATISPVGALWKPRDER